MITLSNFEDQVAERVVARGREYFDEDAVTGPEELVAGHCPRRRAMADEFDMLLKSMLLRILPGTLLTRI